MPRIDDEHRKWWILVSMGAVGGLILLDETVIGVALPSIQRDLGMSHLGAHWVVNAYLLVFAGFAAAGGRSGDVLGLKAVFVGSVMLFGVASLAAGFAEDAAWLIAARAVQGLGAAVIFPASIAMVAGIFPEHERGRAIGNMAAVGLAFFAAGPLVGGFLTEALSWRWIFWINAPLVLLIVAIVLATWVDGPSAGPRPSVDYGGLVTLVGGLGLLVLALMQGPQWGWAHGPTLALLAGAAALLVLFVLIERRRVAPLLQLDLFRNASFSACILVIFSGQYSKIAVIVFGALYLQQVLGMSPFAAGLGLLVAAAGTLIAAAPAGRLADRCGVRRPTLAALALAAVAILWIGFASRWDSYALLLPGLVVWGLALAICFMPPQKAVMSAVPGEAQGQASGILMTSRLLGATIGMAICSALFTMTGSFEMVFLVTGAIMLAVLLLGWLTIEDA